MLCHYEGQRASIPTSDDRGVRASHQVRDWSRLGGDQGSDQGL